MVQNFRDIAENHMNVNFRDKNFVTAIFFRDYRRVVAPPTNLTRGVRQDDPFGIPVLHQRLSRL